MKISLKKFEIISSISIMILGTLLHFTYDWSNHSNFVSLFSSINESVWEHLKLIFFPSLLFILIGFAYFKNKNYVCQKTKGLFLGMFFIVSFFYTYCGILGKNIAILDIASFFAAVLLAQIYSYKNKDKVCSNFGLAIIMLLFISFLFFIFTFNIPNLGIFK